MTIAEAFKLAYELVDPKHPIWPDLHPHLKTALDMNQHLLPNWRVMPKPILTVDFDGVISTYKAGWYGAHLIHPDDAPVPGAFHFLREAVKHFTVLIFSSRTNTRQGRIAVHNWMLDHGMPLEILRQFHLQPGKPSAFAMIDDRAISFQGDWNALPDPASLLSGFKPWYYHSPGWRSAQTETKL